VLDASDAAVQRLSKVIFGQVHRLAVMVGIAHSDGIVNPGELAATLGFAAQSSVQGPLRDLEAAGLISRLPNSGGKTFYRRNTSLVWDWVQQLETSFNSVSRETRLDAPRP